MNYLVLLPASVAAVATLANYILTLRMSVEVQRLRADIANYRREDAQDMRDWVEGRMQGGD